MTEDALITHFAPAERSGSEEVARQRLIFSSSQLVKFLDYIPDIVLVLNTDRQIIYANRTALLVLGNEPYGSRFGEVIGCIHADEMEGGCGTTETCSQCGAAQAILSALRGEQGIRECRINQKDGCSSVDLRVWSYPVTIEGEQFVVYIAADIANEKRREVLERIFLHDILNTAGNIRGFADILKEAEEADAEEFRDLIYDLSSRLIDEINAHRELVAAEHGELTAHPEEIDSVSILTEIRNYYSRSELCKDYTIELSPDCEQCSVTTDKTLLSRVLSNMVKNALEASVPEAVIILGSEKQGDSVRFSVHNPGYIPKDIQLQIFQRSFSTKGTGRGLGTYSMRLLSERYLKGSVSFTSSEEEGTTFYGTYPDLA